VPVWLPLPLPRPPMSPHLTSRRLPRPDGQTLGGSLLWGGRGQPGRQWCRAPPPLATPRAATHGRRCQRVTATCQTAHVRRSSSNWARRRKAVRLVTQNQPPTQATKRCWAAGSCKHRHPQLSPPPLCHRLRPDRALPRLRAGWLWPLCPPPFPAARRRRHGCPLQWVAQGGRVPQRLGLWRVWLRLMGRAPLPSCHASARLPSSVSSLSAWVRRGRPQILQLWT